MFDLYNFSQAVAGIYDASMGCRALDNILFSLLARIFDSRGAQISGVASALALDFLPQGLGMD